MVDILNNCKIYIIINRNVGKNLTSVPSEDYFEIDAGEGGGLTIPTTVDCHLILVHAHMLSWLKDTLGQIF